MSVRPWRCLWRDVNSDVRITTLPEAARLLFISLIPELEDDGSLPQVPGLKLFEQLAAIVKLSKGKVVKALPLLIERELVTVRDGVLRMVAFAKRQLLVSTPSNDTTPSAEETPKEREQRLTRERVARHRAQSGNASSVTRNGVCNGEPVTKTGRCNGLGNASSVTCPVLPSQTLPSEKSESEEDSEKTKTTKDPREDAPASASPRDAKSDAGASRTVTRAAPPDRWELQEILRKHAGSGFDVFVTGEGEKSLYAFIAHRHEQGADLRADFEVLGDWVASGQKFDDFAPPKSLQGALGKPTADGVRDGAGLQKAIATARAWASKQERAAKKPKAPPAQKPVLEGEALKAHLAGRNPFARPAPTPAAPEDAHGPTTAATR